MKLSVNIELTAQHATSQVEPPDVFAGALEQIAYDIRNGKTEGTIGFIGYEVGSWELNYEAAHS